VQTLRPYVSVQEPRSTCALYSSSMCASIESMQDACVLRIPCSYIAIKRDRREYLIDSIASGVVFMVVCQLDCLATRGCSQEMDNGCFRTAQEIPFRNSDTFLQE
jgi:hypothetical protein